MILGIIQILAFVAPGIVFGSISVFLRDFLEATDEDIDNNWSKYPEFLILMVCFFLLLISTSAGKDFDS